MGRCAFPVTRTDGLTTSFGRLLTLLVTTVPIGNLKYRSFDAGPDKSIHFNCEAELISRATTSNDDGLISILSSFNAFGVALSGTAGMRPVYICVPEWLPEQTKMGGSSLGLATLLALFGFKVPETIAATGYVTCFGMGFGAAQDTCNEVGTFKGHGGLNAVLSLPVDPVDNVPLKVRGAAQHGFTLFVPARNWGEVGSARAVYAKLVRIERVGDAVQWLEANGIRSQLVDGMRENAM